MQTPSTDRRSTDVHVASNDRRLVVEFDSSLHRAVRFVVQAIKRIGNKRERNRIKGKLPESEMKTIGKMVEMISYYNARDFFGF